MDVTVREVDVAPVQVQGPKAKEVLVDLVGARILEVPYYGLMEARIDDLDVVVSRTGYTGEVGYEIYLYEARKNGIRLWDAVLEAGRPHGLEVIGPSHIRRIEAGILAYGADIWLDTNPFEVDMGYPWMVDLDQEADFIGKAALRRITTEGISRKLVGLEIGGEPLGTYIDNEMIDFFPVLVDGRQVGQVTSACWSPRLEKNIGFAMLPIEQVVMGSEVEVETPHGRERGVVVPKPFYDPTKEIPKT